jgi:RNA polymerase sigma-70 factor (ECF subfamily)
MSTLHSPEPFLAQIETHKKILFKVAYLYCANEADRQDLMQDILIQLWRSFGRFDGRSRFSTWMYRVSLNVAISWRRARRRHVEGAVPLTDIALEKRLIVEQSPEASMEVRVLLAELLQKLDGMDRALALLYLDGYDHADIGETLGITITNVATRLSRIKQKLRRAIADEPPTQGDRG